MKYILEFNQFKDKLFEGGGAGKEFKFASVGYDLKFEYSKDGLKLISKEVTLGEKMDLYGYQDGMGDISVEDLFEVDIDYKLPEDKVGSITVDQIIYYVGEGELFDDYDKETTLKEIVAKGETINIQLDGSGSLDYLYGGGYILPSMGVGTELSIDLDKMGGDDFGDYINDVNVHGLLTEKGFGAGLTIKATNKFNQLWDVLFRNPPYYSDYLESFEKDDENDEPLDEISWWEDHLDGLRDEYGI